MKKLLISVISILTLTLSVGCSGGDNKQTVENNETQTFEQQLIKEGEVRVGTSPDYAPFEFIDENGEMTGFDIELMNKLGEIVGVDVVYQTLDFDTIVGSLQTGNIDIGLSGFTYKEGRDVIFGTPYYESAQVALLPADSDIKTIADLEGKNIGAGLGTTGDDEARKIPNANVSNPANQVAFQMLLTGQLDAYICDDGVAINYAANGNYKILEEVLTDESMSFIIRTENTEIARVFNEALEGFLGTPEYTELLEKYGLN